MIEIFRQQYGIPDPAFANEPLELPAVAPGSFVKGVGGEENAACLENLGFAKHTQGFDGRGDSRLHVRRTAASDAVPLNPRCNERQMNRVEMAIELQSTARFPGPET